MTSEFEPVRGEKKSPETETPETKPRWNFFEMFGKGKEQAEKATTEKAPESKAEKKAAKTKERGLGERLLKLLSRERDPEAPTDKPQAKSDNKKATAETPTEAEEPVERKNFAQRAFEGARNIGRLALGLISETREDIRAADTKEGMTTPTDTEPLDKAESNVEEALHEVDEAETKVADAATPSYEASDAGGDFTESRAKHEAAVAANYWREIDRAVEDKRRHDELKASIRGMGILAIGAGLLAAGISTANWLKLRKIHREQQRAEKRERHQNEEVQRGQEKIEELKQKQVEYMSQPERQEHVQAVSEYANLQAERIREVAREQERLVEQVKPKAEVAVPVMPTPEAVRPEVAPEKKKRIAERVAEIIAGGKAAIQKEGFGGAVGGALGGVVDYVSGKVVQATTKLTSEQPTAKPPKQHQPVQAWLNGILLILAVVLMIVILLAVG